MTPIEVTYWRCSSCSAIYPTEKSAVRCCLCSQADCDLPKVRHRTLCGTHLAEHRAAKDAEVLQRLLAMPAVKEWDGPVLSIYGETYYPDLHELITAWWEGAINPTDRIVQTCAVRLADTPDIATVILEHWADQATEDALQLSEAAEHLIAALMSELDASAPVVWDPMYQRIDPAVIEAALNALSDQVNP